MNDDLSGWEGASNNRDQAFGTKAFHVDVRWFQGQFPQTSGTRQVKGLRKEMTFLAAESRKA